MKALKIIGVLISIIIVLILIAVAYLKLFLPDVGAAPVVKIEASPERLERGKYLAENVTVCVDCHSTRDWTRYAGPIKTETWGAGGEEFGHDFGFPGFFYSKNITPSYLSSWTDGEILRAVTSGVSKDGTALFPLMNYMSFGNMDQEDIYSIIAYIRTLAPVESTIPERKIDFPVSFLINTMPKKGTFSKKPGEADKLNYGKYLVNAGGCIECHSRREKGEIVPGSAFGGGQEFKFPSVVAVSANITPDKETGIGKWTMQDFVNRFKLYRDSTYIPPTVAAGEPNTPMPWMQYSGMKLSDLEAIYTYLHQVKAISHKVEHFKKP